MIVPVTDFQFFYKERLGLFHFATDIREKQISAGIAVAEWCVDQFGEPMPWYQTSIVGTIPEFKDLPNRWAYHLEIAPILTPGQRITNLLNSYRDNFISIYFRHREDAAAFRLVFEVVNYSDWVI